jgi:hypothetical protein
VQDITPEDSVTPIYLVQLTEEEATELEQLAAQEQARVVAIETQRADRQSALEKLGALGLTEDEVRALISANDNQ